MRPPRRCGAADLGKVIREGPGCLDGQALNGLTRLGSHGRRGAVLQQVKPFIQNVHHFRDDGIRDPAAPYDDVVIVDEAQRAWDQKKTAYFERSGEPSASGFAGAIYHWSRGTTFGISGSPL